MKQVFLLAALLAATAAKADDLLFMPTARHLPDGMVRGEAWAWGHMTSGSLAVGLTETVDARVYLDTFGGDPGRPTADLAYYYLSPIADISPGISGGIRDAADETRDGRRIYACATMNRSLGPMARFGYTEVTAGAEVGRRSGPLLGVKTPVYKGVYVLGEYDGLRFNIGLRADLGQGFYAQAALRSGSPFVGLGWRL